MVEPTHDTELKRLRRERDLCLRLLSLGRREDLDPFLEEALALIIDVTGAAQGFLELRESGAEEEGAWSMARGCSDADVEDIQSRISRGIIAEAIATGETIQTDSALSDVRFNARESVRARAIEAVLCAPIGGDAALGVLYLQGKQGPRPFMESDRELAELFAHNLAPLADRLLMRQRVALSNDPTRDLRARYRLDGIVGRSAAFASVLEQAMLAAPLDVNVLLTGDSGTGKSQLAHAIHDNSARTDGPFVELNCAALPEALIESELFGAMAGSHSEARKDRPGKVAAAEGGTLFLDEIGELPVQAQAKLLQLLQSREYYPLGATRAQTANVRVIAATNSDLEEAMNQKRFREDLFYRLRVLPLQMPTLDQRVDDLSELARSLTGRACRRHGFGVLELSPAALRAIEAAEWPGNIRQLENTLEAAAIRATGERSLVLGVKHLFPERGSPGGEAAEGNPMGTATFQEATREFQRELLIRTLQETDWNVAEAARRLDLARSHAYNLIKAFGLARDGSQ